jgi:hypothetical protein
MARRLIVFAGLLFVLIACDERPAYCTDPEESVETCEKRMAVESTLEAERSKDFVQEMTMEAHFDAETAEADRGYDTDPGAFDCEDFDSHREAQEFYERSGGNDPYWLDEDGDGTACEWLP